MSRVNNQLHHTFVQLLIDRGLHRNIAQTIWQYYLQPFDRWMVYCASKFKSNKKFLKFISKIARINSFTNRIALHGYLQLFINLNCEWSNIVCRYAAKGGHLHILDWGRSQKYKISHLAFDEAAVYGHLHILEWACCKNLTFRTTSTFNAAAYGGHMHIIQWLYDHNCPWNERVGRIAVEQGYLDVLQWIMIKGYQYVDSHLSQNAATWGHLHILEWLYQGGVECSLYDILYEASCNGHAEIVQWAISKGGVPENDHAITAIVNNRLNVLKILLDHGIVWDNLMSRTAAYRGRFDILKWAHENGYQFSHKICNYAAGGGKLEILMWLRRLGYPWSEKTCAKAAAEGHLHILEWLRNSDIHGKDVCPWDGDIYSYVLENDYMSSKQCLTTLNWIYKKGCPVNKTAFWTAVQVSNLETVKWLHKKDFPCSKKIHKVAIYEYNIFKWLYKHGYINKWKALKEAKKEGCSSIIEFLNKV